eukprot:403332301
MKSLTSTTLLIASLFTVTQATHGVDISARVSNWQCLKDAGYTFAIPRAWCSYGGFDSNVLHNIEGAHAAGIPFVDVYAFPCRSKSATDQVAQLVKDLGSAKYGQIWVDVETNPSPGCSWSGHTGASNCQYLSEMVSAIKSQGKVPGIYATYYMWESIMGGANACTSLSGVPLWYAHYDNSASFSDFKAFGGWTKPHIKQYKGTTTACGVGVDLNFY